MKVNITFVKLMGRWFADLEYLADKVDINDCEMIAGTDLFLETLSKGSHLMNIEIIADEVVEDADGILTENAEVEGAGCGDYNAVILEDDVETFHNLVWLCPVTDTIFGYYPKKLYFKIN